MLIINTGGFNTLILQAPLGIFYYPFFKIKSTFIDLSDVAEDNRRLQLALVEASLRVSMMEESRLENQRLRRILGFESPSGYTLMPAKVIILPGGRVEASAVINRGSKHGVQVDQPVINEEGLVGRIGVVSEDFATIQLLTDPANRVAARIADTREMGIVKVRVDGMMILDNFSINSPVREGDEVISSGLGGIYPPGLSIGRVASVEIAENELFAQVTLQPAVSFNRIEELFVLKAEML